MSQGRTWQARAEAAERELARLRGIEGREVIARILARRLWKALAVRTGLEADTLFAPDELRVVEPSFDAAATLWERHQVTVVPCRRILDDGVIGSMHSGAGQAEMYLGRWPDGSTRNMTRAELLMMGGQDPDGNAHG